MSVVAPKLFKQSDSGAVTLTGQVGTLISVLDACLIINKMFTAVSGASFVDNTTEARLEGGTAFVLFQGPTANNDEAYFGMSQKFERLRFDLAALGVQGTAITLAWEYWNGSAWTGFTPSGDTTSEFTADGSVSWSIASLTGWVANAVNSSTLFWVRVRFTAGTWSTNPTVNYVTATGWTKAFTGTNQASYRQGAGNGFFLDVNDNAVGAGGAREARCFGYETMSAVSTGTGQFPTSAQVSVGVVCRKSTSADATARNYIVLCDDRSVHIFTNCEANANYFTVLFGDIYSLGGSGDGFRTAIMGRVIENNGAGTNERVGNTAGISVASTGHYVARSYTGSGTSLNVGKHTDAQYYGTSNLIGAVQYPNGAGGGLHFNRLRLHEIANNTIRGWFRGVWGIAHGIANFSHEDVYQGTGADAGRSFYILKTVSNADTVLALETSDTWDTN